MKTAFALLLLFVPAFAADMAAGKEISAAVDTWKQAMLKGDAAALGKLYHNDLTYTHSGGKTETKAEAIAGSTKPGNLTKAIEIADVKAHVYGNTGVAKVKADFTSAAGVTTHLDMLMVWLKSPQGWQLVARQATKLP